MRARLLNQNQNEFLLACALCVYICDKYPYRIMRSNIIFHHINNYCSGICLMRFSLQSDNFTRLSQQKQKQKNRHTHTQLRKKGKKIKDKVSKRQMHLVVPSITQTYDESARTSIAGTFSQLHLLTTIVTSCNLQRAFLASPLAFNSKQSQLYNSRQNVISQLRVHIICVCDTRNVSSIGSKH